jgi:hypothetical protein
MEDQCEFKVGLVKKIISDKTIYDRAKLLDILHNITTTTHIPISLTIAESIIMSKIHDRNLIYDMTNELSDEYKSSSLIDKKIKTKKNYKIEHIVPGKFFDNRIPMIGDMHNMYVCPINKNNNINNISRGFFARSIAYFYVRYPEFRVSIERDILDAQSIILWNKHDPVNKSELIREANVYRYQHNHNPFILIPELIDIVFCADIRNDIIENIDNKHYNISTADILLIRENFYKQYTTNGNIDHINSEPDDNSKTSDGKFTANSNINDSANIDINIDINIDKMKYDIDKAKLRALRILQAIRNSKNKKEKDRSKKRYKKIKKQLADFRKILELNGEPD